jgi:hypothetical protein
MCVLCVGSCLRSGSANSHARVRTGRERVQEQPHASEHTDALALNLTEGVPLSHQFTQFTHEWPRIRLQALPLQPQDCRCVYVRNGHRLIWCRYKAVRLKPGCHGQTP